MAICLYAARTHGDGLKVAKGCCYRATLINTANCTRIRWANQMTSFNECVAPPSDLHVMVVKPCRTKSKRRYGTGTDTRSSCSDRLQNVKPKQVLSSLEMLAVRSEHASLTACCMGEQCVCRYIKGLYYEGGSALFSDGC